MAISKLTGKSLDLGTDAIEDFTSIGIDDNATSTAITIDSSENVGIGIDDPQATLHVKSSDANTKIGIWNSGTAAGGRFAQFLLTQGSTFFGASDKSWQLVSTGQNDGTTQFQIQNWNGSGYTTNASFYEDGNVNMHYGVRFGSDTAAANVLDDYEEGTWTPALTYGGGNTGQVMTSNIEGTYVKIGSLVTANIRWTQSTKGTSTGAVAISLPFAVDNTMNTTALEAQGSLGYYQNVTVTHSTLMVTAWHSSSTVQFYYRASDTSTNMNSLTDAHVGDGFDGRATVTYRTT